MYPSSCKAQLKTNYSKSQNDSHQKHIPTTNCMRTRTIWIHKIHSQACTCNCSNVHDKSSQSACIVLICVFLQDTHSISNFYDYTVVEVLRIYASSYRVEKGLPKCFPLLRRIWYRAHRLVFYFILLDCTLNMTALTQQNTQ